MKAKVYPKKIYVVWHLQKKGEEEWLELCEQEPDAIEIADNEGTAVAVYELKSVHPPVIIRRLG